MLTSAPSTKSEPDSLALVPHETSSPETPSKSRSLADELASLPKADQEPFLSALSPKELSALAYDWKFWGRPTQQRPAGNWRSWLIMAGRGFGKTRTGAEDTKLAIRLGC